MKEFGYFRAAAAVPVVKAAGVEGNTVRVAGLYRDAVEAGADLVVFPELALTGYSCGDLFAQEKLLKKAEEGLLRLAADTGTVPLIIGLPLRAGGMLFNCAAFLFNGKICGIVPKTFLPNSHEFYEQRWFASAEVLRSRPDLKEISFGGSKIPFGADLLFSSLEDRRLVVGIEICEDLWTPLPPSSRMALAGASIIANPSASNELAGKSTYRRELILGQSGRGMGGYIYVSSGVGESTSDTVYGGAAVIAENGRFLAGSRRFLREAGLTLADMDIEFLNHERESSPSFSQAAGLEGGRGGLNFRVIDWGTIRPTAVPGFATEGAEGAFIPDELKVAEQPYKLLRQIDPRPFVPSGLELRKVRCEEIFSIQSQGLASRLAHIGCKSAVIGLSGGLDSTLALLVTLKAFEILDLDKRGILAYTMPGFGTTDRTLGNVNELCRLLGIKLETLDIRRACEVQMEDLDHSGEPSDVAYENVQARYRTAVLMNKANMVRGIVVGTGDLSELALGWCTYNGDHMSMYAVNTGVPKTLVTYLVDYAADTRTEAGVGEVLKDIINTPISPELLPPDKAGEIAQKTEELVGPYELHDFFLYHGIRCGFSPAKVFFHAKEAFCMGATQLVDKKESGDRQNSGMTAGSGSISMEKRTPEEILKWLEVFYRRFFSQQFKRSCLPDGPKVGTIALSPRGDWRMPSDASASDWLEEIQNLKEQII